MDTLFAQIRIDSEPHGRVGKCSEVKGAWDLESGDIGCVPACHNLSGTSVSSSAVQKMISSLSNSPNFYRMK